MEEPTSTVPRPDEPQMEEPPPSTSQSSAELKNGSKKDVKFEEPSTAIVPSQGTDLVPRREENKNVKKSLRRKTQLTVIDEALCQNYFDDYASASDSEEDEAKRHMDASQTDAVASTPFVRTPSIMRNMQRRSKMLFHHTAYKKQHHLKSEMELIKEKLKDTYLREGDKILLHGYLHIQIIRANNLRNTDGLRGCQNPWLCHYITSDYSDPYVTVHAGVHRLVKTPVIHDNLNPEWNQDFYVPICHFLKELEFRVKDWDRISSGNLGSTTLSVHELIQFAHPEEEEDHSFMMSSPSFKNHTKTSASKFRRCGVHKTVHLDDTPRHGSLEYFVEFIPKDLLHTLPRNLGLLTKKSAVSMVVPGVYFSPRQHNRVRLYINADDGGESIETPPVPYGNNGKVWKPRRFFRDIYDSISQAQHMVYIVGWSVDYTISLLRGEERTSGLNPTKDGQSTCSPLIGELMNQKADEGVTVNMMVWDDKTSNGLKEYGVVGTRDEQLRNYFKGSKVNLRLVPMVGGDSNMLKQFRNSVYYTHHQKCVICDTPQKELVAYVGGIDLTYGRYDDGSYPLFRTLATIHKDDYHQACFDVPRTAGPREPWHDIHSRVQGAGTLDLLKNFEERWVGQGGMADHLVVLAQAGISTMPSGPLEEMEDDNWNTQLFRSIDERTAKLTVPTFKQQCFEETTGVQFDESKKIRGGKRKTILKHILRTESERVHHFIGDGQGTQETVTVARPLDYKRDLQVDSSVHKALVHHIRNAQHSIYIESQYFMSSSFQWSTQFRTDKCCNLVAAEITLKICEKIEAGERFTAYIVVPMWPEGLPNSSSVQDILFYQSVTMKSMYKRIQKSIDRRRKRLQGEDPEEAKRFADITAIDYLNFYCLATREVATGPDGETGFGVGLLNKTRRHLVYTHSKMTIVDDAVIICGSANVNQRSLDGGRDSELLMGAWQPGHLATRCSVADGDVHGFRLHCWAHLTGTMEEIFKEPSSLECVRRVNEIARNNWDLYTQDQVVQMTSYLVPFPVKITGDGDVIPLTTNGKFPDTSANILGGAKPSLPKFLTT